MKSAIAAFISAAASVPEATLGDGALSLLITGDEEGVARDGTRAVVELLQHEGERIDHCLVEEPTSAARLGDMIKIGRRGSLNAWLTVEGVQGHVAYPDRAANPAPACWSGCCRRSTPTGWTRAIRSSSPRTWRSPRSRSAIRPRTSSRPAPAHGSTSASIPRIGADLIRWLEAECRRANAGFRGTVTVDPAISGEAFLTAPDDFVALCAAAIEQELSVTPVLSTTGGTSDARFIRDLCPVIEFGLVGNHHAPGRRAGSGRGRHRHSRASLIAGSSRGLFRRDRIERARRRAGWAGLAARRPHGRAAADPLPIGLGRGLRA
jgi:succinyl-diaminopimelate desuccinylase